MFTDAQPLQDRLLTFIAEGIGEFDALAREVFAFQFERNPIYRAYCEGQQRTPATIAQWPDIPAVPTAAFKDFAITCFPVAEAIAEFHTSGTTAAKAGKHFFQTLALYDAAIRPNFAAHLMPENHRLPMLALTPAPPEAPHSSLAYMLAAVMREFGTPASAFYVANGQLLITRLVHDLAAAQKASQPVCLLGTAFAFVHLFDHLAAEQTRLQLPEGSRAMETGGFKGRARELPKRELSALFEERLGIPAARVVNEYGMTELSTQFYDQSLRTGRSSDQKQPPAWARVVVIDPRTGHEAARGQRGLIRVFDLANLWSTMCVQTEDWGVAVEPGTFEILGRATGAEVRGCSLTAETWPRQ